MVILLVYTIHSIDRTAFSVLLAPIGNEFLLSDRQLGLLAGFIYVVPFALASIPIGMLVDRVNRVRLLALLIGTWSAATSLAGFSNSFVTLSVARAAVGAAESGTPPTGLSLISDYFVPKMRAMAVAIFYIGAPLGVLFGSTFAGRLSQSHGWRTTLVLLGVPGLLLSLAMIFLLREPERRHQVQGKTESLASVLLWIIRPPVVLAAAGIVVASVVALGTGTWLPVFLVRSHSMDQGEMGTAIGLMMGLGGVVGSISGGVLARVFAGERTERLTLVSGALLMLAVPALLLGVLARSEALAIGALVPFGVILGAYYGPAYGAYLNLVPDSARGRSVAILFILTNIVGGGLGPYLVGEISDWLARTGDPDALRHAMLMLPLLAAVSAMFFLAAWSSMRRQPV